MSDSFLLQLFCHKNFLLNSMGQSSRWFGPFEGIYLFSIFHNSPPMQIVILTKNISEKYEILSAIKVLNFCSFK
jgi:hypothetical protein